MKTLNLWTDNNHDKQVSFIVHDNCKLVELSLSTWASDRQDPEVRYKTATSQVFMTTDGFKALLTQLQELEVEAP